MQPRQLGPVATAEGQVGMQPPEDDADAAAAGDAGADKENAAAAAADGAGGGGSKGAAGVAASKVVTAVSSAGACVCVPGWCKFTICRFGCFTRTFKYRGLLTLSLLFQVASPVSPSAAPCSPILCCVLTHRCASCSECCELQGPWSVSWCWAQGQSRGQHTHRRLQEPCAGGWWCWWWQEGRWWWGRSFRSHQPPGRWWWCSGKQELGWWWAWRRDVCGWRLQSRGTEEAYD